MASRLVSSAKSWLSHAGVDRTAPILPLNAPEGVAKISPVEASRRYLEHLREAWDSKMPDAPFAEQQVLVTVPASFDAVARELTLQAAEQAGYKNLLLLEEPQAAFYAWIERHPDWRERVQVGDLILVVDIGGGTTDFTLIAVTEQAGELQLERVAVGEHILLGGDNIDLALARHLEQQLAAQRAPSSTPCNCTRSGSSAGSPKNGCWTKTTRSARKPVTILGRGTGLVGGTIKTKLLREDVDRILGEGFLPAVSSQDMPQRRKMGFAEIGLPYAADAAITRHLGALPAAAGGAIGTWLGAATAPADWQRPRTCCSTAACCAPTWCDSGFWKFCNGWLEARRPCASDAADGRRSDARGGARRGLLRAGSHGPRRANSRRRSAHVLSSASKAPCPRCPACPRR